MHTLCILYIVCIRAPVAVVVGAKAAKIDGGARAARSLAPPGPRVLGPPSQSPRLDRGSPHISLLRPAIFNYVRTVATGEPGTKIQ